MLSYKAFARGVSSFSAPEKLFTKHLKLVFTNIDGIKFYVCSQVAIKIIDKTQLNPGSLQKVSF